MVNLKVAKSLTLRVLSASTGTQCPFVCKALHFSSLLELYMLYCCVVVPFVLPQVTQAHSERSAYNNLLIFAYFISRQNRRVCMENATKTL